METDAMGFNTTDRHKRFGGMCCFPIHGRKMQMKVDGSFKTLLHTKQTTWHYQVKINHSTQCVMQMQIRSVFLLHISARLDISLFTFIINNMLPYSMLKQDG